MDSCFPPLASLSLSSSTSSSAAMNNNNNKQQKQKNRHSTGGSTGASMMAMTNGQNGPSSMTTSNAGGNTTTTTLHNYQMDNSSDYLPKLQVLQDLDLYYIRQIACSLKELDLEQKIDLEIKMREGSAKLLAACNNSGGGSTRGSMKTLSFSSGLNSQSAASAYNTQMLEAAKNLLTSNERMTAYMAELQRRKRDKDGLQGRGKPTGRISLSEIRMPLMWRDTDHFKNKGDHRRFAVFCLAKIGTEIFDTTLLCPVDRNLTDISFPDSILFSNVTPDFELKLEVYAVMLEQDLSIASTPRKIKNTIHSSISRTVGKRLAANLKDELNNTKIGPKFDLIATATLSLAEASDLPHTHDLRLITPVAMQQQHPHHHNMNHHPNNNNSSNNNNNYQNSTLPLFGHYCCRLAVAVDSLEMVLGEDLLAMVCKSTVANLTMSNCYAKLNAFHLDVWDDAAAAVNGGGQEPRRSIELTRDTKLKLRGDQEVAIFNMEAGNLVEYVLRLKTDVEQTKWYATFKRVMKEHQQWGDLLLQNPMQLATPETTKGYYLRAQANRQRSLYDQVPVLNDASARKSMSAAMTRLDGGNNRPSVHEIFAIPPPPSSTTNATTTTGGSVKNTSPTLNEFRGRTYSSGRSSHSSSIGSINSRKSHHWFSIGSSGGGGGK